MAFCTVGIAGQFAVIGGLNIGGDLRNQRLKARRLSGFSD